MQDAPDPEQLLQAVARFLRDEAGPALSRGGDAALAYQARVAANMLDMAARQGRLAPAAQAAELQRLQALLGQEGGLTDLNQALADRIAQGRLSPDNPALADTALADHLWQTTLDKLAVDQPSYDTYRRRVAAPPDKA